MKYLKFFYESLSELNKLGIMVLSTNKKSRIKFENSGDIHNSIYKNLRDNYRSIDISDSFYNFLKDRFTLYGIKTNFGFITSGNDISKKEYHVLKDWSVASYGFSIMVEEFEDEYFVFKLISYYSPGPKRELKSVLIECAIIIDGRDNIDCGIKKLKEVYDIILGGYSKISS